MNNINVYSFILLFNALLAVLLAINVIIKKKINGKIYFIFLMLSIFLWSLFDAFGLATDDYELKIIFAKAAYIGVVSIAPFLFLFFFNFLQSEKKLSVRNHILLWVVPVIVYILTLTNEFHHLIWISVTPIPGTDGYFANWEHGIVVYLHMLFSYSLILSVLIMLIRIAYMFRQVYRRQAIFMTIATLLPFVGNFLYIFRINPLTYLDLTPFLFTVSGFMITLGFTSYRFLDTKPIAYGKLFINLSDSVLVLDGSLMIADVNPPFEKLFGIKNLIGKNAIEEFAGYPELVSIIKEKFEEKKEIQVRINGKYYWLDIRISPLYNRYKDIIGFLIVFRDITENKNNEYTIKESEKNLKNIIATKDKFFSIIAHDLKNPFSALLGLSEIFKNEIETLTEEEKKDFAETLYIAAKSTYKLIENLFEWTRLQTGKFEFAYENLNLREISTEICSALLVNALRKNIKITNEIPKDTMVYSDKNMLKLLFNNLITNAIKFSYKGSEVRIASEEKADGLEVCISDSGIGIKKADIEKLFRTDISYSMKGTEKEEGTGLGLILCKEIIDKSGGSISVESEAGKGSRFMFLIPNKTEDKKFISL
jgi:PAS domain S-box-containing protein